LRTADERSRIQFSDKFHGDGAALFKACVERALEGIVSKHALAPYRSGRSRTWLKTKRFTESTFIVIGTDRVAEGELTERKAAVAEEILRRRRRQAQSRKTMA
jgi:bifunctional non-homologous end joining protein LigD